MTTATIPTTTFSNAAPSTTQRTAVDYGVAVLRIALDECAVKQRTGGPLDDAADMAHTVWTGELPFTHGRGAAIADALNTSELPAYAAAWGTESA